MFLITFAVPCYNSAGYMRRCIDSLLTGGDEVEIIIVNDGSTDETRQIADEYAAAHANVRAVHKENGGHGSGVNKGLELASGLYYKVVDSDDWLDVPALAKLLETLRAHRDAGELADLYITNFVYEKLHVNKRFVRHYRKNLPAGRFFGWKEVKRFHTSNCLLMHSLMYRTDKLRESGMVLPEHTFYVDNIYAYKPLPLMHKLFYLDVDLYRYFIGRDDQSVSAKNIVRRYKQQIRVMKEMITSYTYEQLCSLDKGLARYMKHDLSVIMTLTLMFTTGGKDELDERKAALSDLWQFIYEKDRKMYKFLRFSSYTTLVNWMPFRMCGSVMVLGYRYYRSRIKCS